MMSLGPQVGEFNRTWQDHGERLAQLIAIQPVLSGVALGAGIPLVRLWLQAPPGRFRRELNHALAWVVMLAAPGLALTHALTSWVPRLIRQELPGATTHSHAAVAVTFLSGPFVVLMALAFWPWSLGAFRRAPVAAASALVSGIVSWLLAWHFVAYV